MYPDIYGESLYTLMMNNPDKLDEYMDKLIKFRLIFIVRNALSSSSEAEIN